jgi:hypothetical protein
MVGSKSNVKTLLMFFKAISVFEEVHNPIIYKEKRSINGIIKALLFHNISFLFLKPKTIKELTTKIHIAIVLIDKNNGRVPTKR